MSLTDGLERCGLLTGSRWREALHAVPRHLFVPRAGWAVSDQPGSSGCRIDAAENPAGWWDAVYSDSSIVIQADDGAGDPGSGRGLSSSSVSAPGVVIAFLELLDLRPHDRVLEIGTGSGWTAAMLCHVCGDRFVSSIEVDPVLATTAAGSLKAAGYAPYLIIGDGASGDPARAPYDRVHVTCAVSDIPRAPCQARISQRSVRCAWARQIAPG